MGTLWPFLILFAQISSILSQPFDNIAPVNLQTQNKSITQLVNEQTEAIKKIVASQKINKTDYPVTTKIEPEPKPVLEKQNIEDMRIPCQQYIKLLTKNASEDGQNRRAEFVTKKPSIRPKPTSASHVTAKITVKTTTTTTPKPVTENSVKVIKLEPVILQKTVLSNGEVVYYWYKSAPTPYAAPQYIAPQQFPDDFRHEIIGAKRVPTSTVAPVTLRTPPATLKTTTTPQPLPEQVYSHQLKFVVPLQYSNDEQPQYPNFDRFAYYPKELQPSTMNIPVPYVPVFHMIKAISIPDHYGNQASK